MTIGSLQELSGNTHAREAEFCIVGAGFAGLLIARRLAREGRSVILLESGDAQSSPEAQSLNEIEDIHGRFQGAREGRSRGLGGTSTRWTGGMLPLTAHDFVPRLYADLPGWPIAAEDLERYNHEIEALMHVDHRTFEAELFQDTAYPIAQSAHFVARWMKWPRFRRCNIGANLRQELARLPSLTILLDATVCDFRFDEETGGITAVEARGLTGHRCHVRAREFVFAAGSIETTRLVLLLNRTTKERAFASCKVLGRYFQDHMLASVGRLVMTDQRAATMFLATRFIGATRRNLHLELSPRAQVTAEVPSAFVQIGTRLTKGSSLAAVKEIGRALQRRDIRTTREHAKTLISDPGAMARLAWWRYIHRRLDIWREAEVHIEICAEQRPSWCNRISLSDDQDVLGVPKVRLEWSPSDADDKTFRVTAKRFRSYLQSSGLSHVCSLEWSPECEQGRSIAATARDMYHPSGSTRMGVDPEQSVVGSDLRCHHVRNLTLASASVFPSPGSANPTFTIMQLALYAADCLLAHSRQPVSVAAATQSSILTPESSWLDPLVGRTDGRVTSGAHRPTGSGAIRPQ